MKKTKQLFRGTLAAAFLIGNGIGIGWGGEGKAEGPVPDQARVSLEFAKDSWKIGEAIEMEFTLENQGSKSFWYEFGGDYRGTGFPLRFKVSVFDETGQEMVDLTEHSLCLGGLSGTMELPPGDRFETTLPLLAYAEMLESGRYTVRVYHDFGWTATDENPFPVAEATLELKAPDEAFVEARVAELCVPLDAETQWQLRAEAERLRHPAFLTALEPRARDGVEIAFTGIGGIETRESTALLVDLLESDSVATAALAARHLMPRIPMDPDEEGTPIFAHIYHWSMRARSLPERTWDDGAFREPVLEAGRRFLGSGEADLVGPGTDFFFRLAGPDDGPLLEQALQVEMNRFWPPRDQASDNILNRQGLFDGLVRAVDALIERGYRRSPSGNTAALLVFARQLTARDIENPPVKEWRDTMTTFLSQNPPVLREVILEAIPQPASGPWLPEIMARLEDEDLGVVRKACFVAGKSGDPVCLPSLLRLVESSNHRDVMSAASNSAVALGGGVDVAEAWTERLIEKEHMIEALREILAIVLEEGTNGSSGNSNMGQEECFALRDAWRAFLKTHRVALSEGKRFAPDDPALVPELAGLADREGGTPVIQVSWPDGRAWPLNPSGDEE